MKEGNCEGKRGGRGSEGKRSGCHFAQINVGKSEGVLGGNDKMEICRCGICPLKAIIKFLLLFQNITIFAIGVGPYINDAELKSIATSADHVYKVRSYSALEKLKKDLAWKACQGKIFKSLKVKKRCKYCSNDVRTNLIAILPSP